MVEQQDICTTSPWVAELRRMPRYEPSHCLSYGRKCLETYGGKRSDLGGTLQRRFGVPPLQDKLVSSRRLINSEAGSLWDRYATRLSIHARQSGSSRLHSSSRSEIPASVTCVFWVCTCTTGSYRVLSAGGGLASQSSDPINKYLSATDLFHEPSARRRLFSFRARHYSVCTFLTVFTSTNVVDDAPVMPRLDQVR